MSKKQKKVDDSTEMSDGELVESHIALSEEKHPPTVGFLQAPLIFVFVFGSKNGVRYHLTLEKKSERQASIFSDVWSVVKGE